MASDQSQANLVWDEYKYRHTHCWKVVFQLTAAVVFLSAIPYLDPENSRALQWRILLAPALGVVLAAFGIFVMCRELSALSKIRIKHRLLQKEHLGMPFKPRSWFSFLVTVYLICLGIASAGNMWIAGSKWLPHLGKCKRHDSASAGVSSAMFFGEGAVACPREALARSADGINEQDHPLLLLGTRRRRAANFKRAYGGSYRADLLRRSGLDSAGKRTTRHSSIS